MYRELSKFSKHIEIQVLNVGWSIKARLHGSPRLINMVESMKLNSTVKRYCLHGSTKVHEAVDFKMAANELVREGVVLICDYSKPSYYAINSFREIIA
jgi:hypothetical protein